MNIRIVKSELKTTAAEHLDITSDLEQDDRDLEETLKAYENQAEDKEE